MSDPLFVVPIFLRSQQDYDTTLAMIKSLREYHADAPVLFVDDHSPDRDLLKKFRGYEDELRFGCHEKSVNSGFSQTVNVGLEHALEKDLDVVLTNADLIFQWGVIPHFQNTKDTKGNPAAVVGARLLYPVGLIQHAGIYFSMLHRVFEHRYKYAPHDLPEALTPRRCPVTGALQYIRHDTLKTVGIYDPDFNMAFEDVDYCMRVFNAGLECVYNPDVLAYHYESMFRGQGSEQIDKWHAEAWTTFVKKHQHTHLGEWIWPLV